MAAIAAPRDSWRSSARARARSVWASSGAAIRSTCSSPADRARSPGRRPITISPTVSGPRESGSPPGVGDRGSRGGELGAAGGQTRVRQHEGLADGAGREYGVIADPVGDPGRGVERVWPAAEEQFVGDAAQRDAQPVEADCDQGGDEREDTLRLVVPPCEVQAGQ